MKTKKIIYLTEFDVIFGSNNYLKNVFSIDKKDKENECITDLWYDCDHVKINGEGGRGDCMFTKHETTKNIYIITPYEYDFDFEDIIEWWLNGCENEVEINNNWHDWNKVKSGIAYRGGSGYSYSLYAKELINS